MAVEHAIEASSRAAAPVTTALDITESQPTAPVSNLAALLDQFTANITNPGAHTIGSFAETVQALHSEMTLLARHFASVAQHTEFQHTEALDAAAGIDWDDAFGDSSHAIDEQPIEPGLAASEELEHLCRQLSR